MLIIKVYTNFKEIDEVRIQNMGFKEALENGDSIYKYEIKKPDNIVDNVIYHIRESGYEPLLKRVMEILEKEKNHERRIR